MACPDNPSEIILKTTAYMSSSRLTHTVSLAKMTKQGVKDILLESAVTTIQDLEDSVAAVDAEEKWRAIATGWVL